MHTASVIVVFIHTYVIVLQFGPKCSASTLSDVQLKKHWRKKTAYVVLIEMLYLIIHRILSVIIKFWLYMIFTLVADVRT